MSAYDAFLTKQERSHAQRLYVNWVNNLKPRNLAGLLYNHELIRHREKQEVDAKKTDYERSEYLFEIAVIRATYDQIQKLRELLVQDDQVAIARGLPCRPYDHFWESYDGKSDTNPPPKNPQHTRKPHMNHEPMDTGGHPRQTQQTPHGSRTNNNIPNSQPDTFSAAKSDRFPDGVAHPNAGMPNTDRSQEDRPNQGHYNPQPHGSSMDRSQEQRPNQGHYNPQSMESGTGYQAQSRQGGNPNMPQGSRSGNNTAFQRQPPQGQNQPQNQGFNVSFANHSTTRGPIEARKSELKYYHTIDGDSSTGQGFCLIIANFTNDMKGYQRDIVNIEYFFRTVLKYTVETVTNLKKDDLMYVLDAKQKKLSETASRYDRFFLFILSHGDERGIQSCLPDGKKPEPLFDGNEVQLDSNNKPIPTTIDVDDIVSRFTHDKVKTLRSLPKVFFIQTCQGEQIATAASGVQHQSPDNLAVSAAQKELIAVGADTLVCRASQPNCLSWVDDRGSWLITETISAFMSYYKTNHIIDILTEVNRRISRRCAQNLDGDNVCQLPIISHNLTKKLYFLNP